MLVAGPPRVRAFAENGTLLNRVLVQLWPLAVALLLAALETDDEGAREPARRRGEPEEIPSQSIQNETPAPDDASAATG